MLYMDKKITPQAAAAIAALRAQAVALYRAYAHARVIASQPK